MDPVSRAQAEGQTSQNRRLLRGGHDPSIGRQWPKGVSGNPGGRRKKPLVTKMLENIFENRTHFDEIQDSMALTLKSGRMAGVLLLREAAERLEGKVTQEIQVDGNLTLSLAETIATRRKAIELDDSES